MEFDLWFNFVPIFSVILLTVVTIITVVQKLKLRWPVQVNCWFCNTNTKIWRQQLNWWMCPHCEQYNGFSKSTKYSEPVCRTISTILSSMIAYNMDFVYLPIGGLFFQVCAHWSSSSRKRNSDTFLIFFWICMIVLLPFKDAKLIKTDLQNAWFSLEYITSYHMIMLFILAIGFTNIKPKSHKSTINKNMSFKKIESSTKDTTLPDLYTNVLNEHNFNSKAANDLNKTITNESLFSSNTTKQTPFYTENSVNSKVTSFQTPFQNHESQLSSAKDSNAIFNSVLSNKKSVIENFSLNDSLSTLSMLSLSEDKPKYTIKAPKIFEKKVYGTNSLELFRKANKRNILSPPKLKSFTQTSWVAGGYWQEDIDVPPLSRSSSQSSGFGSTCSNFAPSREPSVHEFDQCSVMSDVTQSCSTLRQNNIHPVGSFNQQNAYFSFPEPKSLVSNQTMRCASPNFYASQSFLLPEAYKKNNSVFIDQSLQGQNVNVSDIKNPSEIQMFPSHTTIVTSPVWLPALLCGSLVLNIVVLCTTLLR
nr:PREDICTED: uncharacterized protein LOC100879812 isoform X6 [Megachile rotundata]